MPKLIFGYSNFSGSGHFSIRQARKTPFFTCFSTGPPEFCPGWIFNFLPKSGRPGLGIRPQPKISVSECIFLMSCEPFYLGHFFFVLLVSSQLFLIGQLPDLGGMAKKYFQQFWHAYGPFGPLLLPKSSWKAYFIICTLYISYLYFY